MYFLTLFWHRCEIDPEGKKKVRVSKGILRKVILLAKKILKPVVHQVEIVLGSGLEYLYHVRDAIRFSYWCRLFNY